MFASSYQGGERVPGWATREVTGRRGLSEALGNGEKMIAERGRGMPGGNGTGWATAIQLRDLVRVLAWPGEGEQRRGRTVLG